MFFIAITLTVFYMLVGIGTLRLITDDDLSMPAMLIIFVWPALLIVSAFAGRPHRPA